MISLGLLDADIGTLGEDGGTGEEAIYLDHETLGLHALLGHLAAHLLVIAFLACEDAVLNDDLGIGAKVYLVGVIELQLVVVGILIDGDEVFHLLVGHDDGLETAVQPGTHLELKQGVVLLLQVAHPLLRRIDEEEVANHRAIAHLADTILLPHYPLDSLQGKKGGDILLGRQQVGNLLFSAVW